MNTAPRTIGCVTLALLLVSGCSQLQTAATDHDNMTAACTALVMDYAIHRDRGNGQAWANLFTEDGEMHINGVTTSGRKALLARVANSARGPSFTHLMSSVQIKSDGPDRARGISYVSVYIGEPGAEAHLQAQLVAVGEYRDQFVRTTAGWKIARREFVPRINVATPPG